MCVTESPCCTAELTQQGKSTMLQLKNKRKEQPRFGSARRVGNQAPSFSCKYCS